MKSSFVNDPKKTRVSWTAPLCYKNTVISRVPLILLVLRRFAGTRTLGRSASFPRNVELEYEYHFVEYEHDWRETHPDC